MRPLADRARLGANVTGINVDNPEEVILRGSGSWVSGLTNSRLGRAWTALLVTLGVALALALLLWSLPDRGGSTFVAAILIAFFFGMWFYLFGAFAHTAASDLSEILVLDAAVARDASDLAASPRSSFVQATLGLLSMILINLYAESIVGTVSLGVFVAYTLVGGIAVAFAFYIVDFVCRLCRVLKQSAERVPIDLLRIDSYQCYATPVIRHLAGIVVALCVLQFVPIWAGPDWQTVMYPLFFGGLVVLVPIVLALVYPLLILRNRIRDAKLSELAVIDRAVGGDMGALESSRIGSQGQEFKLPDLVAYQSHIRGLWTWPVHAYLQRLVIFGVLPPLTWVMSALIEILLESRL